MILRDLEHKSTKEIIQLHERINIVSEMQSSHRQGKMPEASDNGSQPYRKAVRFFEMAGKATPHIKPCCR